MTFRRGTATDDRARREAMFGPLADASAHFAGLMRAAYSPLQSQSLLCAACHEDNNDHDLDGDYLDEGSVPSEEPTPSGSRAHTQGRGRLQDVPVLPYAADRVDRRLGSIRDGRTRPVSGHTATTLRVRRTLLCRTPRRCASSGARRRPARGNRRGHQRPGRARSAGGIFLRHALLLVTARGRDGAGAHAGTRRIVDRPGLRGDWRPGRR